MYQNVMKRNAIKELYEWKENNGRKPLVILGARQVGKTWLMKEFGKEAYKKCAYVNFEDNDDLRGLFEHDFDIQRIIANLQWTTGVTIDEDTLIILDEIQEAPRGITALKYFQEKAPQYHVIAAGSLLGIAMHKNDSFPVGKVDFMHLYPLSFYEFLNAIGEKKMVDLLQAKDWTMLTMVRAKFEERLRQYYFVGGMPAAVLAFVNDGDLNKVRTIQKSIIEAYERDFSKHAPAIEVPRIRMVWHSIPSQLSKENRKFIYGMIKEGARAKDYETAIMWLSDCGLVHKVSRVNAAGIPLRAYEDLKAFKLFIVDVGLLGCMTGLRQHTLLDGNDLFVEFKGALTEQYVCQQLKTIEDLGVYYYTNDRGSCEVDFVVDTGEQIIPVEVKAEVNLRAKSLKTYQEKFSPEISVRTSMADYKKEGWLVNLPLYAIDQISKI